MIIDMHVHSKCSDGNLTVAQLFKEAKARKIDLLSITDHDSIGGQEDAALLAGESQIRYISGVELNVTFSDAHYHQGKPVSLDFLGYKFDFRNLDLKEKLRIMEEHRQKRAAKILDNLNQALTEEGLDELTSRDFARIQESANGALGRPHIADYLVDKRIVKTHQEAFDKYLVKCDVPKYSLHLEEASKLVRNAGGKIVLAHPNDPHGTSLAGLTKSLSGQTDLIQNRMLYFIDGVECFHSRNDPATTSHYLAFARNQGLLITGGSDCHGKPLIMGTVRVPKYVADQFGGSSSLHIS